MNVDTTMLRSGSPALTDPEQQVDMPKPLQSSERAAIKSAKRTLAVLEYFQIHRRAATVGDIAAALKMPQSSTSMPLKCVLNLGYLDYDAATRKFRRTYRVALLGSWIHASLFDSGPLTDTAEALGRETRETVSLGQQNGPHMQYVHIVKASEAVQLAIQVGTMRPMTCAALGRVLLARKPDSEIRGIVRRNNADATDEAHRVKEQDFMAAIEEIRRQGFAESRGKMIPGANTIAMLVPAAADSIGTPVDIAIPLNLVGDFAGGGMYHAFGIVCALFEAAKSGKGQVVDMAMVDGAASLMTCIHGTRATGKWSDARGENVLDGGSHFYAVYRTRDGRHISVASAEPKFYAELLRLTGLDKVDDLPAQLDKATWPQMRERLAGVFASKTRDEWCALMEGSDACFAPVLTLQEAIDHPHNRARNTFIEVDGVVQPAPAPRFSRTVPETPSPPRASGVDTEGTLRRWGFAPEEVAALRKSQAVL
jgi:DNA-binding IclR family transcriptional regulator